ncbi:SPla/RYanodine receptor SPRY [Penicillium expansum]|uniref:Protein SSH4 n=1 Tax=Penicillium expansum TaxID=27334 RepID=A0A0A2JCZ7_PENEN|nr:SPla/RYanodine receptor SPRY [Penicillium expansum]KGO39476.1 SPla/RYanodine receptor SPRY [Penicillium expansum]KGO50175.1 SPla/RYanodine receptor SPRY [Penicillium expansum]KGO55754.1 SPla/RYanodine receptor SPRY [Penicillium expansum]
MQGSEASSPDALAGLPSTLSTVIGNPTTSPIGVVSSTLLLPTPIQSDPSLSQQQIQANLQNVISSLSMEFRPEPMLASGNSTGSTGKGILIGILSAFGSAAVAFVVLAIFFFFKYTRRGRIMLDRIGRPGEYDDEQAFLREEEAALESMDDLARSEYLRAKAFVQGNPPESVQTDISLSQFLAIQEKGVSAWEFQPELEIANCFVEGRTEIEFFDSECSVQTNLPIPKQNDVYYWEAKIYDKPDSTMIGIGVTTKPYPLFRMPGFHKTSVAYQSTGHRRLNQPFNPTPYGPPLLQGDVVGVGYRPRSGTVFFTRNGKKLEDVAHNYRSQNLFPTIGANGPCTIHVNFGQMGFVFIEGNVKKWGLAPMTGSLAPPPPYGSEQGSILLESGRESAAQITQRVYQNANYAASGSSVRIPPAPSPGPSRSPTDISLAQLTHIPSHEDAGEGSSRFALADAEGNGAAAPDNQEPEVPPPEYSSPDGSRRGSDASECPPSFRASEDPNSPSNDSMDSGGQFLPSYQTVVQRDLNAYNPEANNRP